MLRDIRNLPNSSQKVKDRAGFGSFWGHLKLPHHGGLPNHLTFYYICPATLIHIFFFLNLQTPLTFPLFLPMEMGWNIATAFGRCPEFSEKIKQNFIKISEKDKKNSRRHEPSSRPVLMLLKMCLFHVCALAYCCWRKDHRTSMFIRTPSRKEGVWRVLGSQEWAWTPPHTKFTHQTFRLSFLHEI